MTRRTTSGPSEAVARVVVGLGANIGDPRAALDEAQLALRALARPGSFRASSLYRTAPIDAGGPDFLNAVACFDTTLGPHGLLAALHEIEARHGRRRPYRNAPRTLDLDLLLYGVDETGTGPSRGGATVADETLVVPHPRAHLRAFVLEPLAELWPGGAIPGQGDIADLRRAVQAAGDQRIERLSPS
jgi:2-amino-4-hydroxy-6-hydroxymethyldihydropteridine diphosphokinase